jgi:hypothetical protein
MDGFRAVAYVEGGACRLVSRNHNAFKTFDSLAQAIGQDLTGRAARGHTLRSATDPWPHASIAALRRPGIVPAGSSRDVRCHCS